MTGPHLRADRLACAVDGTVVVRDVTLDVQRGEVVGVIGPNGSGKTTLLRTLAGLLSPAAGRVFVDGEDLAGLRPRERARRLAVVGQEEGLLAELTVEEAVALGRVPHRPPWSAGGAAERRIVEQALREVDVAHLSSRPVERLSGGERRRVLLARALAQDATLLVLDEPTNHLDVRHQLELLALVRSLRRTVVIALHDLDLACGACDRIVVLHAGGVRCAGSPEDVLTRDLVAEVFGVDVVLIRHPVTGETRLLLDRLHSEIPIPQRIHS